MYDTHELLRVSIQVHDKCEIRVVGGYRKINNTGMGFIDILRCKVEKVEDEKYIIMAGDFNLPTIDWEDRNNVDVQSKQKEMNDLMSIGFI
jgi:hypothetical protein